MCLAADVPLIESGTAGYLGQVTTIKKVKNFLIYFTDPYLGTQRCRLWIYMIWAGQDPGHKEFCAPIKFRMP